MAKGELPKGLSGAENLPQTKTELVNCFFAETPQGGIVLPRPGIAQVGVDFINWARGSFTWNNGLYAVFGTQLFKIDAETGVPTILGTIAGSSVIKAVAGFNDIVIMAKDTALYTLDKLDFLTDITTNQNFVSVTDVCHVDGHFIYIPTDGEPAFFSDVGFAGTVQPLSFFDAEELPDLNNTCFNFANTLVIGGTDSFELFRSVVTTTAVPFQRISGARHRYGYIGALLEYTNSFLFLGREKGQDFGFYAIAPGSTAKISNPFIDEILAGYAPEELRDCVPGRLKWRGYDLATFTLARDSFGFYKGNWFKLNTLIDGFPKPWLGGFITQFEGIYYTASKRKFGKFEAINTDFGERLAKSIDFGIPHPNNERFSCQSLEIGISQGFNDEVGTVGLFMSRDNRVYGPGLFKSLGAKGKYHDKLAWNPAGGLGNYDGFMGLRIYTTGDVAFAANSLYLNIR